jgi:hypothetical protein
VDIGWDYRVIEEKVYFRLAGGLVAVPMSDVQRIEKTERKKEEPRADPQSPPAQAQASPPSPPGDSGRAESKPGEQRAILANVIAEALALVREIQSAEELSKPDQESALGQIESWTQDVGSTLEEIRRSENPDPALLAAGEDLSRGLRALKNALEQGDMSRAGDMERILEEINGRL